MQSESKEKQTSRNRRTILVDTNGTPVGADFEKIKRHIIYMCITSLLIKVKHFLYYVQAYWFEVMLALVIFCFGMLYFSVVLFYLAFLGLLQVQDIATCPVDYL